MRYNEAFRKEMARAASKKNGGKSNRDSILKNDHLFL
jgi:hypothetical protein